MIGGEKFNRHHATRQIPPVAGKILTPNSPRQESIVTFKSAINVKKIACLLTALLVTLLF
ncbi:MAG: hypothetical protein KQI81_00885 [Deltaproteobacteria bacterium]|nr:hypothetical protein [Deltaproteobacteria bacterium]